MWNLDGHSLKENSDTMCVIAKYQIERNGKELELWTLIWVIPTKLESLSYYPLSEMSAIRSLREQWCHLHRHFLRRAEQRRWMQTNNHTKSSGFWKLISIVASMTKSLPMSMEHAAEGKPRTSYLRNSHTRPSPSRTNTILRTHKNNTNQRQRTS